MVELQNEIKLNEIMNKKIGDIIDDSSISDVFKGYKFKITGGFDKNDFAMKNGIPKGIEGLTEWNKNKRWIKGKNKKNK